MGDSGSLIVGAIICVLAINAINATKEFQMIVPQWLESVNSQFW